MISISCTLCPVTLPASVCLVRVETTLGFLAILQQHMKHDLKTEILDVWLSVCLAVSDKMRFALVTIYETDFDQRIDSVISWKHQCFDVLWGPQLFLPTPYTVQLLQTVSGRDFVIEVSVIECELYFNTLAQTQSFPMVFAVRAIIQTVWKGKHLNRSGSKSHMSNFHKSYRQLTPGSQLYRCIPGGALPKVFAIILHCTDCNFDSCKESSPDKKSYTTHHLRPS